VLVWLPKIKYLGHIIAKEGVKANPANIVSTLNWPFHALVLLALSKFNKLLLEVYPGLWTDSYPVDFTSEERFF